MGYVVYGGEKKEIREWEGQREGGDKRRGKKIEISKYSEIDSNQQCLQHIHAVASGTGRPRASSRALMVTDASSPQATPSIANKQEMVGLQMEFKPEFLGFQLSCQTGQKNGQQIGRQKDLGEALGFVQPVLPWPAGLRACGRQEGEVGQLKAKGPPECYPHQEALSVHCN